MFVCNNCFDKKLEPRWLIIVIAQSEENGMSLVQDYITNHKYVGAEIPAAELYK